MGYVMRLNKLERAVMDIIKENLVDNPHYIEEVLEHGCESGIVSELIYYVDTIAWFEKYDTEIMPMVKEYMDQIGENDVCLMFMNKIDMSDVLNRTTQFTNLLAWFSFEEVTRQLSQSHNYYLQTLGAVNLEEVA